MTTPQELARALRDARDRAGSLLLGLDFDGTLAPIVPRPEDAQLGPGLEAVLRALAGRDDTRVALISGRGMRDLAARVPLDGVYFAGNHGLEIEGPDVERVHREAAAAEPALHALAGRLAAALAARRGVIVEDKGLTLSVHYRLVDDETEAEEIRRIVRACGRDVAGIRLTEGKKVVEIRPDVDWHKGRALEFLRGVLEQRFGPAPAVFIGDDTTDEDAFRVLGAADFAIRVGGSEDTIASATLPDTRAVAALLEELA